MRDAIADCLLDAVTSEPGCLDHRYALADRLRDLGDPECVALEAFGPLPFSFWLNESRFCGSGRGIGIGSGIGRGSGSGSGRGRGSGRGIGIGIGSGIGSGIGRGSGSGHCGVNRMEVGKAYLVHCGDWHTICGRVLKQLGPFTYLLTSVSKICDTKNGDNWEELAAGNSRAREAADYRHYKTTAVVPLNVLAFEWEGALPQEGK